MESYALLIAIGLTIGWGVILFYGAESLYRRGSPLNIIYWGTWVCFTVWYMSKVKGPEQAPTQPIIMVIIYIAMGMALLFAIVGTDKPPQKRYSPQKKKKK